VAGFRDREANGDLVKLLEELLLLHPELSFLQLGQQLRLIGWVHPAPPFAPLSPGPLPATPAPGILNAQQQDALAGPPLELSQIRHNEGMKLPQLPGTCSGAEHRAAYETPVLEAEQLSASPALRAARPVLLASGSCQVLQAPPFCQAPGEVHQGIRHLPCPQVFIGPIDLGVDLLQ